MRALAAAAAAGAGRSGVTGAGEGVERRGVHSQKQPVAHLFRAKEMLGPRLLSYHNVYLLNQLMSEAREAI